MYKCYPIVVVVVLVVAMSINNIVSAFTPIQQQHQQKTIPSKLHLSSNTQDQSSSSSSSMESRNNIDKPELPIIPGDFDWDSKYANDSDWLMGDAVPGKRVLNEMELIQQSTALGGLEEKWRKERLNQEYNDSIQIGWVPKAEIMNGRFAMFFLVTGLLTEYWTGISLPGQVEEMLRIAGVISM
jgi:hypothetical protein